MVYTVSLLFSFYIKSEKTHVSWDSGTTNVYSKINIKTNGISRQCVHVCACMLSEIELDTFVGRRLIIHVCKRRDVRHRSSKTPVKFYYKTSWPGNHLRITSSSIFHLHFYPAQRTKQKQIAFHTQKTNESVHGENSVGNRTI